VLDIDVLVDQIEPGQHFLEAVLYSRSTFEGRGDGEGEDEEVGRGGGEESRLWFEISAEEKVGGEGEGGGGQRGWGERRNTVGSEGERGGRGLSEVSFGILVSAGPLTLARTLSALRTSIFFVFTFLFSFHVGSHSLSSLDE